MINRFFMSNSYRLSFNWISGLFIVLFCAGQLGGQSYKIKVNIRNYKNDTLLLGYYFGDKQYIKDTAYKSKSGTFTFEGDTILEHGMYIVVTQPDHNFFQILLDDHQKFSIETSLDSLNEHLKFQGSKLNTDFNDYIDFLSSRRVEADSISKQLRTTEDKETQARLKKRLEIIDEEVRHRQESTIRQQPTSLLSLIIKWSRDVQIPVFTGLTDQERNQKAFDYYKEHYFDYVDFKDTRNVRIPLFFQKVDRYIQKLTLQHPDSINYSLDIVLQQLVPGSENLKFWLSNALNTYANSKYVGMDGVYVHLVENYYAKGKAPWIDEENLAKMVRDAKALKPLLIDKIAPDIQLFKMDSSTIRLHEVTSPYTVLIFWAPDCGHCKKSMPHVKEFYNKFKSKGVEVMAVCSQIGSDAKKACSEGIEQLHMQELLNAYDPGHGSRFKLIYDLKTTPQIYILDQNKKILTKKIGAEQLEDIMDKILNMKE